MTTEQLTRTTRDWTGYAGEPVTIEEVGGAVYGFGSELATLRLFHKFRGSGRAGFSKNLGKFYFSVELKG